MNFFEKIINRFKETDILKIKKITPSLTDKEKVSRFAKIQTLFKIGFNLDSKISDPVDKVSTYKVHYVSPTKTVLEKEIWDSETKSLYKYWLNNCHDSERSWETRKQLYEDMDMLYYNCSLIARSIELVADEVIQADSNQQPVFIEAKPKVKESILEFFDKQNINNLLRPTALDVVHYGNAAWVLSLVETGVEEVIPINVYQLKDRLQFTPFEVKESLKNKNSFFYQFKGHERIEQLIKFIQSKEESTTRFKSYLFGFQIGDYVLPPWRVLHFRNLTNKSPFHPFGVPVFIHSLAPYRQYDAAMALQILARGERIPREIFKLNIPNIVDPTEKLNFAVEFMREYLNSGLGKNKKEDIGVGEKIVTIDGLYSYEQETPNIDLGHIDDINLLRDDIIVSTSLPRSWVDPNDSNFGLSGVALIQQFKPFARLVFRIQSVLLQNLTQLVKIHLIQSKNFPLSDLDFILSMPYPESQTTPEIISSQSSLLGLANDIIASIEDKILGGEKAPLELIKKVYQKFLPYDDATIENWFNTNIKKENFIDPVLFYNQEEEKRRLEKYKLIEQNIGKIKLEEQINNIIFNVRQVNFREGVFKNRHYYSSRNLYLDFPAELLLEFEKEKLRDVGNTSFHYFKEEVKNKFKI